MRPPIIIIGAHRSGTSATAHALAEMGLFLGHPSNAEHAESCWFADLHDEYLYEAGSSWHKPGPLIDFLATPPGVSHCRQFLERRIRGRFGERYGLARGFGGPWVGPRLALGVPVAWGWKEPRTTLFAKVWASIFPEARFIHVARHPLDVALSLQRRELASRAGGAPPQPGLDRLEACVALVDDYVRCALEVAHLGERYREVRFEDIQDAPAKALFELARFAGLRPGPARVARAASLIDGNRRCRWKEFPRELLERLTIDNVAFSRFGYSIG